MRTNVRLYPWFKFFQNLLFWQAVWFLFFQERLSASEAILLYAVYDIATTALEVPSGYLSDRVGRRFTLILAAIATLAGALLLAAGGDFMVFALAQVCLGAGMAFASGTDSALLYESLAREGRGGDIAAEELRAWRFSFTALALSALLGGLLSGVAAALPFAATAVAAAVAVLLTLRFTEPPHAATTHDIARAAGTLRRASADPVLIWLFALAVAMYMFSHVPFVFGQPFILEALAERGLSADAPAISGAVSASMMLVAVGASWLAAGLRRRIGLGGVLLTAFGMQIGLIGALALSNHPAVIALLLLRMVPDSLARPYILASIQPRLSDRRRATYLSLQSFCGRLIFAATLIALSLDAPEEAALAYPQISGILAWYAAAGLAVIAILAATVRRAGLGEDPPYATTSPPK